MSPTSANDFSTGATLVARGKGRHAERYAIGLASGQSRGGTCIRPNSLGIHPLVSGQNFESFARAIFCLWLGLYLLDNH